MSARSSGRPTACLLAIRCAFEMDEHVHSVEKTLDPLLPGFSQLHSLDVSHDVDLVRSSSQGHGDGTCEVLSR